MKSILHYESDPGHDVKDAEIPNFTIGQSVFARIGTLTLKGKIAGPLEKSQGESGFKVDTSLGIHFAPWYFIEKSTFKFPYHA